MVKRSSLLARRRAPSCNYGARRQRRLPPGFIRHSAPRLEVPFLRD
jgi:hypothetical protein